MGSTGAIRPTRAEIDLGALRHNLAAVRSLCGQVDVMGVVKANGYGHDAGLVGKALEQAGVRLLGVALVEEGLALREAGVKLPLLVVGGAYDGGYEAMLNNDMVPAVFRAEHLERLASAAAATGRAARAHLKVDTGMGRIGVVPADLDAFLDACRRQGVELEGVFSHFANADLADAVLTRQQIQIFKDACARLREKGFAPKYRHLSNSAGVIDLPQVRDGLEINLVRPGLMLYGLTPAQWLAGKVPLRPVLRWMTRVTHVKSVPVGTPISYGSTWRAARPSVIATLPVGYADGYSRQFSSKAEVLVRGRRAKIAGRICMDMCMVDVTDVPGVELGDEVVLLGGQGAERITAEELAAHANTISYEVLCAIGARVPRVAVG